MAELDEDEVLEVCCIAVMAQPGMLPETAANVIKKTLGALGFRIVRAGVGEAAPGATVPKIPPQGKPLTWPQQCGRCNKVKNDLAHARECEQAGCPF